MQKHCGAGISNWKSDNGHKQVYAFMYMHACIQKTKQWQ